MKRSCDITLHLFNFRQLDTVCKSTFKLRFVITSEIKDIKLFGKPYILPIGSKSSTSEYTFTTPPFSPEVLVNLPLNEMCTFRVDIPYLEDYLSKKKNFENEKSEIKIKVELLIYGLERTNFGKKYPAGKDGFSSVEENILKIEKPWNSVHEYTEINFHEVLFCTASLAIHSTLINYEFDNNYLNNTLKSNLFLI